jgi:hypothetical protein
VFEPKRRIHWIAALVIALILILILGVASLATAQEPAPRVQAVPGPVDS